MSYTILCSPSGTGFVTSDNPVAWYDPKGHLKPLLMRSPGLFTPELEITVPISPRQMLFITHSKEHHGGAEPVVYIDVDDRLVNEVNRRTVAFSKEHIIVHRNSTVPVWFQTKLKPDELAVMEEPETLA